MTYKLYSKRKLLVLLKNFAKKIGRTPRRKDIYLNKNMPDPNTYKERFGSFNNAIKKAKLQITNSKYFYYSDKKLLNELRRLAKKLGRVPNKNDLKNYRGAPSMWIYCNRFGSYNNAVKLIGLKPNNIYNYSKKELLSILKKIAKTLGHTPSVRDLQKIKGIPCPVTYFNKFGSYDKAIMAANLKLNTTFTNILSLGWERHCVKIAKAIYGNVCTHKAHKKSIGRPDIWIKKSRLHIDAKLKFCGEQFTLNQIKRYTKDNYSLQFWCFFKHPLLEIKKPHVTYLYVDDLISLLKKNNNQNLIIQTNKFIKNTYSQIKPFIGDFKCQKK